MALMLVMKVPVQRFIPHLNTKEKNLKSNKLAIAAGVTGGVVLLVGLPIGLWAGGVIFSDTYNNGQQHKMNQSASNRVAAAGTWQAAYKDVQRDVANLATVRSTYKDSDPQGFILTAQTACNEDVQTYNGLQTQPLMVDWKPANLPTSFDNDTCK